MQRGFVLPLAIFSIVLASAFVALVMRAAQLSQKTVLEEMKYTQTRLLAESGLRLGYYLARDKKVEEYCQINPLQNFQLQKSNRSCVLKLRCEALNYKGNKTGGEGNGRKRLSLTAQVNCEDGLSSDAIGRLRFQ